MYRTPKAWVIILFKGPEPIDEKRRDQLLDEMAKRIKQFGMVVPGIFFLEMNKPLSYIGGQAMHFFAPIVGVLFPSFEDYAFFFDERDNVELLIQRLEVIAQEEEQERKDRSSKKKSSKMMEEAIKLEEEQAKKKADNLDTQ